MLCKDIEEMQVLNPKQLCELTDQYKYFQIEPPYL